MESTALTNTGELIEEAHTWLDNGRKSILKFYELLWKIRNQNFAEKPHEDFVAFCKKEFEIKAPAITKAERIGDEFYAHGHTPDTFLIDGKYRDSEIVYEAAKLEESTSDKLSKALTWSRDDFKDEKSETPHEPEWIIYCKTCGKSKERHPETSSAAECA